MNSIHSFLHKQWAKQFFIKFILYYSNRIIYTFENAIDVTRIKGKIHTIINVNFQLTINDAKIFKTILAIIPVTNKNS